MRSARLAAIGAVFLLCATPAKAETHMPAAETALLADVRTLASAEFAGRRTGTAGNRLAQAYITRRFEQIGLKPFGASYAIPFTFAGTRAVNLVGHIRGSAHPERYM